tara:strand:+ start:1775 stop:2599 length:825 start_codon:yes stop_codon:yes gene_type:complete
MSLWIVTVNYGSTESTKLLINSIATNENVESIKIIIADNAASATSSLELKKIAKNTALDITIISFSKNLYYWTAANRAVNHLKKLIGFYPDWVIICNNDVTFSKNFLGEKLSKIDINNYPIIGPNVVNLDGHQLNPFMNYPLTAFQKFFWKIYFISYPLSRLLSAVKYLINQFFLKFFKKDDEMLKAVYAVHGSVILFSNYFFSRGGYFDNNFDMYGEELTVAEIAKKLNIKITYFPELHVVHHEHSITSKLNKRFLFKKAKQSHKYFVSNYLK